METQNETDGTAQSSFMDAQAEGKQPIDIRKLAKGEKVETTVAGISGGIIFLDLSAKTEGVLDAAEFTNDDGSLSVKEGDRVSVYFLGESPDGPKFTARFTAEGVDNEALESAWKNRVPVEGTVEKEIKGGYEIRLGKARAFCPFSQTGLRGNRSANNTEGASNAENADKAGASGAASASGATNGAEGFPAGKKLEFLITEFRDGGKSIVVSRRALLDEEARKQREALQAKIKEGDIVKGTVASIHPFGAFVELGGFQALIPISEIARRRIADADEIRALLPEGTEVEAAVLKADWARGKVSLSLKALERDPWQDAAQRYAPGDRVSGVIARIADFGLFVTLEEGVDGLVHISELVKAGLVSDSKTNLRKAFRTGDSFNCEILSVDGDARRISLKPAESRRQTEEAESYLNHESTKGDYDTYNPFAALLKKK